MARRADGVLFGTTASGGENQWGRFFDWITDGTFTVLATFGYRGRPSRSRSRSCWQDGCALSEARRAEETRGYGVVYAFAEGGSLSLLHSFGSDDGGVPLGRLFQSTDGYIYGTTDAGGKGNGTVFRLSLDGNLEYLHRFTLDQQDGLNPFGGLVLGPGGTLFGTTYTGGEKGLGTFFRIELGGYEQTAQPRRRGCGGPVRRVHVRLGRQPLRGGERRLRRGPADSRRR